MAAVAFQTAALSGAQRPVLQADEVELRLFQSVSVQDMNKAPIFPASIVIISNFRLFVVTPPVNSAVEAVALPLQIISTIDDPSTFFYRSRRVNIVLVQGSVYSLKFLSEDKEAALQVLRSAVAKRAWEHVSILKQPAESVFSVRNAGVSGILRRQKEEQKNIDTLTKEALNDMDVLMHRARDIVDVIVRYTAAKDGAASSMSEEKDEKDEMETMLQHIGMVSPITRLSAGRLYHQQVARQVADLLLTNNRLHAMGGMATLTDIYCLYNRARGTDLISPDDLYESVKFMEELNLGMRLRRFATGVMVIEEATIDEQKNIQKLVDLAAANPCEGIDASAVAASFRISLLVAKEQLLYAECCGKLCRDDTLQGLFFFPNFFSN